MLGAALSGLAATGLLWYLFGGTGPRNLGTVENIYGIPYPPAAGGGILVTEALAHTDIYLRHSPLAKQLILTVEYTPIAVSELRVGVRENSFWLSYPQHELPLSQTRGTHTIHIPLTDKLPDNDGSVDLMFFARPEEKPQWILHSLRANVAHAQPSLAELKNFAKSVITQEKPL